MIVRPEALEQAVLVQKNQTMKSTKATVKTKRATCVDIILEKDGCILCEECFGWYQ